MANMTKRAKAIAEKVELGKVYEINAAVDLLSELSTVKFAEAIDVSVNLGVDPRKSDQVVRGSTVLPNGTGKTFVWLFSLKVRTLKKPWLLVQISWVWTT